MECAEDSEDKPFELKGGVYVDLGEEGGLYTFAPRTYKVFDATEGDVVVVERTVKIDPTSHLATQTTTWIRFKSFSDREQSKGVSYKNPETEVLGYCQVVENQNYVENETERGRFNLIITPLKDPP